MRWPSLAVALLLAAVLPAGANGRPPQTNGVTFRPGDDRSLYVRSTFGLLVTHDNGCSFRWVCEQAIGYGGSFDPKYAVADDGTLYATTFEGLRVSRDGGCTWVTATAGIPASDPGNISTIWIDAIDIASNGDVWVATAESAAPNNVFRSTDDGHSFVPRGMRSPTIWWKSVKAARTRPQRVYVTGYQVSGPTTAAGPPPPTAYFERTDTGGESWSASPLAGVQFGATPIVYARAVDPTNADVVYMSSLDANPPAGDRLYRSIDGGTTWSEVLTTTDTIRDVVFHGHAVLVATLGGGSFSAPDGVTFTPLTTAPQLACLGDRDGTLVGCGANWQPDFQAVAESPTGAVWSKTFRFGELAGPLACAAGTTVQRMCEPLWPALRSQFGATGPKCRSASPAVVTGAPQVATGAPQVVTGTPTVATGAPGAAKVRVPASGRGCDPGGVAPIGAAILALVVAVGLGARRKKDCCK